MEGSRRPGYYSPAGDGSHPNDRGYKAMADAIDLRLFRQRAGGRYGAKLSAKAPLLPHT